MRISTTAFALAALYGSAQAMRMTDKENLDQLEKQYSQVDAEVNAEIEAEIDQEDADFSSNRTPDQFGFFRGDAWKERTAEEKFELLWEQIVADDTMQDYLWKHHDEFFLQRSQATFCQNHDELPRWRRKTSHTQGVVAHISWVPEGDMDYTGVFANGTDIGIMRLSETGFITEESEGLFPSLAIKLLHDGTRSTNIVAMSSFHPSTSWNFFAEPFANRVDPFVEEDENGINDQLFIDTVQKKLVEANPVPFVTGVFRAGQMSQDGSALKRKNVKIPYEVDFEVAFDPADYGIKDTKEFNDEREQVMWYDQLARIPEGTTIFDVYGTNEPEDTEEVDQERKKIGSIVLNSPLMTSDFGDKRLFFQHERYWKDMKGKPNWRAMQSIFDKNDPDQTWKPDNETIPLPNNNDVAREIVMEGIREYQCPFAWLLELVQVPQ